MMQSAPTAGSTLQVVPAMPVGLAELAAQINTEHDAVKTGARRTIELAVACGESLLRAKELVPEGQFGNWLEENVVLKRQTAYSYMRLARHRDRVLAGDFETIRDAIAGIAGFGDPRTNRLSAEQKYEMVRLASEDGKNIYEVAEVLGVAPSTVWYWSSDKNRAMRGTERRRRKARQKAAELALVREENARFVMKVGGPTADAYSLLRKAEQALDKALRTASMDRARHRVLSSALTRLYNAEDEIVIALGIEHGATK